MRAVRVARHGANPADLAGRVLCQELRYDDGRTALAKGRVLTAADVDEALSLGWSELHLITLDEGDVHEDEAGARIAGAAAGPGVEVRAASGGHWPLVASVRGMLSVDVAALMAVNRLDGPCLYTLFSGQVVDAGEIVARAKITPFAVPGAILERAERAVQRAVSVRAFVPHRVGAVVNESLGERGLGRFRATLEEKVAWFGSSLSSIETADPSVAGIADALNRAKEAGADVIAVAGTKAMDVLDPTFAALDRLGARMKRHGVPAHPGSLLWLAEWDAKPVIGMPTCGLFSQATVFDLILPVLLSGGAVGDDELASLAHGGLLTRGMAFRFPPYRASAERGTVERGAEG